MVKNRLIILAITFFVTQALFSGEFKVGGEIKTTSSFNKLGGVSTDVFGLSALGDKWALGTWALGNTGNNTSADLNFENSWTSEMGVVAKSFITVKSSHVPIATDWSAANFQLTDAHLEMQGFMFSPGATIWAGLDEDYSGVHINGLGYRKFSGLGFGLKGYRIKDISLDMNFWNISTIQTYTDKDNAYLQPYFNTMALQIKGETEIPLGKLGIEVAGHYVPNGSDYYEDGDNTATSGVQGGLYLNIPSFFTSDKGYTEWVLQTGYGLSAGNDLGQTNFRIPGNQDAISTRFIYSGLINTDKYQIMSTAAAQYDLDINTNGDTRLTMTVGARPSYQLSRNFALMAEYGLEYINDTSSAGLTEEDNLTGILHKVTGAYVITLDSGFWARPQLRLFATFTTWDSELNSEILAIDNLNAPKHSTFGDDENMALNFGINVEAWF